jgi:hypothetical protein
LALDLPGSERAGALTGIVSRRLPNALVISLALTPQAFHLTHLATVAISGLA